MEKYDFAGWVTKNDVKCADGRVIRHDAFAHQNGQKVPLVWMHQHNSPENTLGHVLLQNRPEGVYGYGSLNDTESAQTARLLLKHDDISAMSIYANKLTTKGPDVLHGTIREVSLVLAGANPEATIEEVMIHGEFSDDDIIIQNSEDTELRHSDDGGIVYEDVEESDSDGSQEEVVEHADTETETKEADVAEPEKDTSTEKSAESDKTVQDIFDAMTDEQKTAVYVIAGAIADSAKGSSDDSTDDDSEGGTEVKHNVFANDTVDEKNDSALIHDAFDQIIDEAKQGYSMKRVYNDYVANAEDGEELAHAATYGVDPVDMLFPEAKALNTTPEFIQRDMGWVSKFMGSVHHTPFSRIKSVFADITEDEARARGYMKGRLKKDEVFTLLKRTTTPTMVYKRQRMDRQDVIDITDFDVIAWIKGEMRMMLNEEIARACLVSDGRSTSSDDKIDEQNIRPIWTDEDLYTIKAVFTEGSDANANAESFIDTAIRSRKDYKGSGNPILFTTEDMLTDMLLLKDQIGHYMYDSVTTLATRLRVREIVTVEVMEGLTRQVSSKTRTLRGIIVNPADYNIGADRGGAVNMFDDFDIDYNQQKYLIETRCSGALIRPFSAIAIESVPNA